MSVIATAYHTPLGAALGQMSNFAQGQNFLSLDKIERLLQLVRWHAQALEAWTSKPQQSLLSLSCAK